MNIVIFCKEACNYRRIANELLLGICDYVNCRTRHNMSVFEIDEKDIFISIRPADMLKSSGLRPDYVLFDDGVSYDFIQLWRYNMGGRYKELKSLDELIKLVIE